MLKPNFLGVLRKSKEELGYTPGYTQEGRLKPEPVKGQGLTEVILQRRLTLQKDPGTCKEVFDVQVAIVRNYPDDEQNLILQ